MYRISFAIGTMLALTTAVIVRPDLMHLVFPASAPSNSATNTIGTPLLDDASNEAKDVDQTSSSFDVVRIDPAGAAVFAGRAPPNSEVTVLANGQAVAAAKSDAGGAWAAVTKHDFASAEYEFSLNAKPSESGDVTGGQRIRMAVAPTARSGGQPLMQDAAAGAQVMPAPITFLYNQTTFTSEGQEAAAVLARVLIAQRSEAVSLSGHADERGSDEYNMRLSRDRLRVVANYLRDHGFAGALELIPKGKSEPYTGVDRHLLSKEDAFRLDRRVQLRQTR